MFSKNPVASFMTRYFEPVWESVRAVPIVRIDFGGGKVLTRTLHGNILTSVCTAEGHVLDALPGIYTETAYLDRLNQLRLMAQFTQQQPQAKRTEWLRSYHQRQAEALKRNQTGETFAASKFVAPITKAGIERPVEVVLVEPQPKATSEMPKEKPMPTNVAKDDVANWKALEEDTRLNESTRRRQIHELLADAGLVTPDKMKRPIYKDVLHADLDDPYLGLGKVLFETYPFVKEDAGR